MMRWMKAYEEICMTLDGLTINSLLTDRLADYEPSTDDQLTTGPDYGFYLI